MGLFGKKDQSKEKTKKLWKCAHCSLMFDDKERRNRHMKKAHGEKEGDDVPNANPFGFG